MTRRIAIASQKGGCGKTTVALNLGLALAERGVRTLIVDLDPQGGVGHSLRQDDSALPGLADVLIGECPLDEAIVQTKLPSLALLTRGRLDAVDVVEFERALITPGLLTQILDAAEAPYDVVILDTPAGLGMPTRAALAASHFVLIPLQAEPLALRSVDQILRVLDHVQEHENHRLRLLGLLPTMVDRDNSPSLDVLIQSWRDLSGVLETAIPRADVFIVASQSGLPLSYLGGARKPESRRFDLLATEVQTLMDEIDPRETQDVERGARQLL
ncbi:MAG: AAA family ATPase [Myxococcales bacterium]|nr:AAA family ATPase [Myxococcales bacterium]